MSFDFGSIRDDSITAANVQTSLDLLFKLREIQANQSTEKAIQEENNEDSIEVKIKIDEVNEEPINSNPTEKKRKYKPKIIRSDNLLLPIEKNKSIDNSDISSETTQLIRSKPTAIQRRKSFTRIRSDSCMKKKEPDSLIQWVSEREIKAKFLDENNADSLKACSIITDSKKIKKHDAEFLKRMKQYRFPDNIKIDEEKVVLEANTFLENAVRNEALNEVSGFDRINTIFQEKFLMKSVLWKRLRGCYYLLDQYLKESKCVTLFTKTLRSALDDLFFIKNQKDKTLSKFINCIVQINFKEYPPANEKKDKIEEINEKIQLVIVRVFGDDSKTQERVLTILSELNNKDAINSKTKLIFETIKSSTIKECGQIV